MFIQHVWDRSFKSLITKEYVLIHELYFQCYLFAQDEYAVEKPLMYPIIFIVYLGLGERGYYI